MGRLTDDTGTPTRPQTSGLLLKAVGAGMVVLEGWARFQNEASNTLWLGLGLALLGGREAIALIAALRKALDGS